MNEKPYSVKPSGMGKYPWVVKNGTAGDIYLFSSEAEADFACTVANSAFALGAASAGGEGYAIRPLEWVERGPDEEGLIALECDTALGFYWTGWEPSKKSFMWGLCDELMEKKCDSLATGKAAAEALFTFAYLALLIAFYLWTH